VDRLFALNVGLKFCTPEEYFLGQKPQPYTMPLFESRKFIDPSNRLNNDHITFNHKQEMIIMVGYPGSGKTELVKSVLLPKAYVHINRDTLKTASKCKSVAESALESGMSVVIDNTNPTAKDREEYMKIARKFDVPCRCFVLKVDHAHALHNNKFRELTNSGHAKVPEVAFNTFKSRYQEPTESEGFAEIVEVNFVPTFTNENHKALYSLYLLEK
jgi:bifunctional polynucleotide phosphatase/kinase